MDLAVERVGGENVVLVREEWHVETAGKEVRFASVQERHRDDRLDFVALKHWDST